MLSKDKSYLTGLATIEQDLHQFNGKSRKEILLSIGQWILYECFYKSILAGQLCPAIFLLLSYGFFTTMRFEFY